MVAFQIFRRKKHRQTYPFASSRGSILLVTLSAVVLLLFFAIAIYNIYKNYHYLRIRDHRLTQLQWQSRSLLSLLAHQVTSSPDFFYKLIDRKKINLKQLFINSDENNNDVKKQSSLYSQKAQQILNQKHGVVFLEKTQDANIFELKVELSQYNLKVESSLILKKFSYSDYLFYFNKNLQLIAVEEPLRFYGPIFVSGNLELGAYMGNIYFYKSNNVITPLLYSEGKISEFRGLKNPQGIIFGIGTIDLDKDNPIRSISKETSWQALNQSDGSTWFMDQSNGASQIAFLTYGDMVQHVQKNRKKIQKYSLGKRGGFSEISIVNPKLLRKQFLGFGTGSKSFFNHNAGYIPNRVYVARIVDNQKASSQHIHPIEALDNSKKPDQNVSYGSIQFLKDIVPLDLPDQAFADFGVIRLGGRGWSRIARDLPIRDLYLNGKTKENQLKGNDFFYDATKKELRFFNEYHNSYYKILDDAKPDGKKRDFPMMKYFPAYGYVNGKKKNMTAIKGRIIFDVAPPAGSTIGILTQKPDIYIRKEMPETGMGVFVDKPIYALHVDLGQLADPDSIIVYHFFCPIYVTGNAATKIVIVSEHDVYLGDINNSNNASENKAVTIVSKGVVWALNKNGKTLSIKNVWLHSAGDQLFSVYAQNPEAKKKNLFLGSATFSGLLTNAFVEQSLVSSYLYTIEYFDGWNFVYDSSFIEPDGQPDGVPVTYTIEGVNW